MANLIELSDLVRELPAFEQEISVRSNADKLQYVGEPDEAFVPPMLIESVPIEDPVPAVLLVSAPAAVGKSTVARQVAIQTGSPLWDLAGEQVGTGSLTGAIVQAFGPKNAGDAFEKLSAGELAIVLDALDETQLLSGQANFQAFLEDVLQYGTAAVDKPVILLFAREDVAELIEIMLLEKEVNYGHYRIDFFDEEKAKEFVKVRLQQKDKPRTGKPYLEARDQIFEVILRLLDAEDEGIDWSDRRIKNFIGYAPVLEAIAEYLNVDNPLALMGDLGEMPKRLGLGGELDSWRFLLQIIRDLLIREQEKALTAMKPRLEEDAKRVSWSEWETLFTPGEQEDRVLAERFELPSPHYPPDLPERLRGEYEAAVSDTMPDHPFKGSVHGFANIVFREYLFAKSLTSGNEELTQSLRQAMRSADYLPTPLLAQFLFAVQEEGPLKISGPDFGFVYESAVSQGEQGSTARLGLWTDSETAQTWAAFFSDDPRQQELIRVMIPQGTGELWFWRRLLNADISIDRDVEFGVSDYPFSLGPDVNLSCEVLRTAAPEMTVKTDEGEDVELDVEQVASTHGTPPQIRSFGDGRFGVAASNLHYPWIDYEFGGIENGDDGDLYEDFRLLRKGLLRLRAEGYDAIARHKDIINEVVYRNNPRGLDLFSFLEDKGIIDEGAQLYALNRDRLGDFGINWVQIERGQLTEPLAELLSEFAEMHQR